MDKETIEKAAVKYRDLKLPDDLYDGFIAGAKWMQDRMYSEEEVYTIASYLFYNMVNSEKGLIHTEESFKKWFEQVKKK